MKAETKVVIAVIVALFGGEALVRVFESSLSADVRQMLAHERIRPQIAEAQAKGRFCVLVLGNSLARAAVDRTTLEEGLREKGYPDPLVIYLTPDASGINEWTAAYRKQFPIGEVGGRPDLVILLTGPSHLLDHPVRSPEKLAAFHASARDRPEILSSWLTTTSERSRFLLASVSRLFANRERIRPLLFYRVVPGYETTAQRLNRPDDEHPRGAGEEGATVIRLTTLFDSLDLPAERVLVAAVPMPESYEVPGPVGNLASKRGIRVYQESALELWPMDAFPDGYHLGKIGAKIFTKRLLDVPRRTLDTQQTSGDAQSGIRKAEKLKYTPPHQVFGKCSSG